MYRDLAIGILVAAALVQPTLSAVPESIRPVATDVPAGEYRLDPSHASLIFRVNHLGFSHFTSQFRKFDATLTLDPRHPEKAHVTATIDSRSIEIVDPKLAVDIQGPQWFDSAKFPQMTFRSTSVALTGPNTARVTGELSLRGVTVPVSWDASFNRGYAADPYDPQSARLRVSAPWAPER